MDNGWPVLSLFSGPGGMDLGFKDGGFDPKLAVDADPAAVATYRRNHPGTVTIQRDLSNPDISELLELWSTACVSPPVGVIGGPPCQSFSRANVHMKEDDVRRFLPLRYADILAEFNRAAPLHFFVFENVAGLRTELHRPDYLRFLSAFDSAGFRTVPGVLDAQKFGVAQRRTRLFIVGVNRELYPTAEFWFPEEPPLFHPPTVREKIEQLPEPVLFRRGLSEQDMPHHPNHWAMAPRSWKFRNPGYHLSGRKGRSFRVLQWDAPSQTVAYGHREVHVHPSGHRRLSVYEAMLLQGFPEWYVMEGTLSAQIRQVADAVPPPLATAIAKSIDSFLRTHMSIHSEPLTAAV